MKKAIPTIIVALVLLAGCGGSSDKTADATRCFENALANQTLHGPDNCADNIAYKTMDFHATCTHKAGNEYICDATGRDTKAADDGDGTGILRGGFYDVTYDGKRIVYEKTT